MALIEFKTKPVINGSQHGYYVFVTDNGQQFFIRGGPEGSNAYGTLFGSIEVSYGDYIAGSKDWDSNGSHFGQVIFSGSDAEVLAKFDLAIQSGSGITASGFDYNLPINGLVGWLPDIEDQNSNTVVAYLADAMGLSSVVQSVISNNSLYLPGFNTLLAHSIFERTESALSQALTDSGMSIGSLAKQLADSLGQTVTETLAGSEQLFRELMVLSISSVTDITEDSISRAYWDFLDAVARSLRVDPLVIDMNGDGIKLDSFATSNALFDLNGDGIKENTGWTQANRDDTFLVIDKNSNGNIDDISEMFGNQTIAGFTDLKSYDSMPIPRLVQGSGETGSAANDNNHYQNKEVIYA